MPKVSHVGSFWLWGVRPLALSVGLLGLLAAAGEVVSWNLGLACFALSGLMALIAQSAGRIAVRRRELRELAAEERRIRQLAEEALSEETMRRAA